MKKFIKALLIPAVILLFQVAVFSQSAPPPPPGVGHGSHDNQPPGGGAPIGAGIGILMLMAAGYGAKKIYDLRKLEASE